MYRSALLVVWAGGTFHQQADSPMIGGRSGVITYRHQIMATQSRLPARTSRIAATAATANAIATTTVTATAAAVLSRVTGPESSVQGRT